MSTRRHSSSSARSGANPVVFEVSWEVCCQVGGIYTVLRSRAPATVSCWADDYCLIGPYREAAAKIEFEEQPPPDFMAELCNALNVQGVAVRCGRWIISGRPQVLLIDLDSVRPRMSEIRHYLLADCGIAISADDRELNDIVAFGHATADLLTTAHQQLQHRPLLAHFHEWQGAAAIPFLKHRQAAFPTVFTTHATTVGRSLSAAHINLYDSISSLDAAAVAREHGIESQFLIERAAAQGADVFSTVSEITALESECLLGRKADILLPNGLNVELFAAPYEFQVLHRENKKRIHEFVMGHFFPSYTFDLDRTLYVFTAGRYEYRNKGMDVFIDALHYLNQRLKARPNGATVVAFVITRAPYRALNVDSLNRKAMFDELHATCAAIREDMRGRLVHAVTQRRLPTIDDLLNEYAVLRLKRMMHAWQRDSLPTIVTHDVVDDRGDAVLCQLRQRQLFNRAEDPVKVIYHPEFVTATDPLLGMDYDQFVRGCNMGVFASYYEPWGYTPLDCVVRGIPAVTSDLSGFGAYVQRNFPEHERHGIYVAPRRGVDLLTTTQTVCGWMYDFTQKSHRERITQRNQVEGYAGRFDWQALIRHYLEAWSLALERYYPQRCVLPSSPAATSPRPS